MRPEELVPQVVTGTFMNRRNEKVLDKQQMKERQIFLERQRDLQTERSFEANLFKDHLIQETQSKRVKATESDAYGFIKDQDKI